MTEIQKTYLVAFLFSMWITWITCINTNNTIVILFMCLGSFVAILASNKEDI